MTRNAAQSEGLKELMLSRLTDRARNVTFQRAYDEFVLDAVAPLIQDMVPECGQKLYYQSFPCTRVVGITTAICHLPPRTSSNLESFPACPLASP